MLGHCSSEQGWSTAVEGSLGVGRSGGLVPGLAPVSEYVQRFETMGFRSLAPTITPSVTCHQVGSMTGSVFPNRHLLGKFCQGHQDRWQLQGENRGQTSGTMPIMQFIQVCAASYDSW